MSNEHVVSLADECRWFASKAEQMTDRAAEIEEAFSMACHDLVLADRQGSISSPPQHKTLVAEKKDDYLRYAQESMGRAEKEEADGAE